MKEIKVEWCERFIKKFFEKHQCKGVYTNLMFDEAEKAGLYTKGTYGSPFSEALSRTTKVRAVRDGDGNFIYHVFELV